MNRQAKQLSPAALDKLRNGFQGEVLAPSDHGYDEARTIFNSMIDRRPAAIAQCRTVEDVVRAVRFGRESGLEIAVRGGGHGVAGKALTEGGLVVDMRQMNAVTVDPDARTATVAGGATMSHLDRAAYPHGLATTGGRVSSTGVAGFLLGGGSGWLERKFGLACDNLLAAELVTADGSVVRASETENPELFWGLHGGGGNFGVATSFTLRLHELPAVTVGVFVWQADKAGARVVRAYREFMESAPDEVGGGLIYLTGPALPFVPEHLVGARVLVVVLVYSGPEAEARHVAAPLLGWGHEGGFVAQMPYPELQSMIDDPPGYRNYWSAEHLTALPDEAVDRFCARAAGLLSPSPSQYVLLPMGGAVARGPSEYPIPWRRAPWVIHPLCLWERPDDDAQVLSWVRAGHADFEPWSAKAVYLNFIGDEGRDRIVAGFGAETYGRLAKVKARYDPDNVFHLNHNIVPAG